MAYKLMTQNELAKLDFEEYEHDEYEGYLYALVEVDSKGNPVRTVYSDGIEPEDAYLFRDLSPLADEIINLGNKVDDLEEENKRLKKALDNLRSNMT